MTIDTDKLKALKGWRQLKMAERGVFITACTVADTGVHESRYDDDRWFFQIDEVEQALTTKNWPRVVLVEIAQIERAGLIASTSGNGMYEIVAKVT